MVTEEDCENLLLQILQWNGFSPLWFLQCAFKFAACNLVPISTTRWLLVSQFATRCHHMQNWHWRGLQSKILMYIIWSKLTCKVVLHYASAYGWSLRKIAKIAGCKYYSETVFPHCEFCNVLLNLQLAKMICCIRSNGRVVHQNVSSYGFSECWVLHNWN